MKPTEKETINNIMNAREDNKRVCIFTGARPNFVKVAPIIRAIRNTEGITYQLVYAGRQEDPTLEPTLFDDLQMPAPDVFLGVDCENLNELTGRVMAEFEHYLESHAVDNLEGLQHWSWPSRVGRAQGPAEGALPARKRLCPVSPHPPGAQGTLAGGQAGGMWLYPPDCGLWTVDCGHRKLAPQ